MHAPFPSVHNLIFVFLFQSVFHLSLCISENTSLVILCLQDYKTNLTRALGEGEGSGQLVNKEKADKFEGKFYAGCICWELVIAISPSFYSFISSDLIFLSSYILRSKWTVLIGRLTALSVIRSLVVFEEAN